jgi:hypothetical protein
MLPGHLVAHVAPLAADSSIGLVASAIVAIDARGRPISPAAVDPGGLGSDDAICEHGQLARSMAAGNPLRCSAVTLRISAFNEVSGFDSSLRYVLDWDLWLRLSRQWKVAWLAQPSVQVRWHSASETHRFKIGLADLDESAGMLDRLFAVDLKDDADLPCLRRAANDRLSRAFLNRAYDALKAGRPMLAREALRRGVQRSRGLIKTIASDPKLCISMATLAASPRLAARLFGGDEQQRALGKRPD